jgi:Mrp family chromosome partitioning ATPase
MAGVALGGALGLGTELLDSTFSRPEQVSSALNKPVLASFSNWYAKVLRPLPPTKQWQSGIKEIIETKKVPVFFDVKEVSERSLSEKDLLALYQSIVAALPDKTARVVNISSSYSGEGVTTIAQALAVFASSKLGQNVLFAAYPSTDVNGASMEAQGVRSTLLESARGRIPLKDTMAAVNPQAPNLGYAALCDNTSYDSLITNADAVSRTLEDLKKSFSLIVIPTPGIVSSPAGITLAKLADGVVFVIEAEKTRAPVVKQAMENIAEKGGNIIGTVLNKQIHYIPEWLYKKL